jgi:glutamate racemase
MDQLVLACTHYPYVRPLIERICGPDVKVIDPAPAVARQVARLLGDYEMLSTAEPTTPVVWTSGDTAVFRSLVQRLGAPPMEVRQAFWEKGELSLP